MVDQVADTLIKKINAHKQGGGFHIDSDDEKCIKRNRKRKNFQSSANNCNKSIKKSKKKKFDFEDIDDIDLNKLKVVRKKNCTDIFEK